MARPERGFLTLLLALCALSIALPVWAQAKKEWITAYILKGEPDNGLFTFRRADGGEGGRAVLSSGRLDLIAYAPGKPSDIRVGDYLKAYGTVNETTGRVEAVGLVCRLTARADYHAKNRMDGRVKTVEPKRITLEQGGRVFLLELTEDCAVELLQPATRDMLVAGMYVAFSATRQGGDFIVTEELRFYPGKAQGLVPKNLHFPKSQPERASYVRPRADQQLDISPPGFCWWRLVGDNDQPAPPEAVSYLLRVRDAAGAEVYLSPKVADPVHVPDKVLAAGRYTWTVDALDIDGKVLDHWPEMTFTILPEALPQPWVRAQDLLARVPSEHPRVLFFKSEIQTVRAELAGRRKGAFEHLKRCADGALQLKPMGEPVYDRIEDKAKRRLAYTRSFWEGREHHESGMRPLALMYLMTGEEKYAAAARALLLEITEWKTEGVTSVSSPYGDELGLGVAKAGPQTYDWLYDYLTPQERARVEKMLADRAEQILDRLTRSDYLYTSGESHNGRLIAYLGEFAVCLKDHPRAPVWLDYSMRGMLTVFPHWGGKDGGWNEGIGYGQAYNDILLPPMESISRATGFDLWQRPFFKKVRYFFMYSVSPGAEIQPFGDGEQGAIARDGGGRANLLRFHAAKFNDPVVAWFANRVYRRGDGTPPPYHYIPDLFAPAGDIPAGQPEGVAGSRAFFGVGWAAIHTDIGHPEKDLFVLFKSSPYGSVSHSYADQNTFTVVKGGAALASLSGAYWPTYGAPFHADYTRQTMAKNGILVNGKGQVVRQGVARGQLTDFRSMNHIAYACGEAAEAYGGELKRFLRHVLVVSPSLIVVADDLEAPGPAEYQWLLQGREAFELDEAAQTLVSKRKDQRMDIRLFTADGFAFHQTDQWPIAPETGYPSAKEDLKGRKGYPETQWHFTAATREKTPARRIAAVMFVPDPASGVTAAPRIEQPAPGRVEVTGEWPEGRATVHIALDGSGPMLRAEFAPAQGASESIESK